MVSADVWELRGQRRTDNKKNGESCNMGMNMNCLGCQERRQERRGSRDLARLPRFKGILGVPGSEGAVGQ